MCTESGPMACPLPCLAHFQTPGPPRLHLGCLDTHTCFEGCRITWLHVQGWINFSIVTIVLPFIISMTVLQSGPYFMKLIVIRFVFPLATSYVSCIYWLRWVNLSGCLTPIRFGIRCSIYKINNTYSNKNIFRKYFFPLVRKHRHNFGLSFITHSNCVGFIEIISSHDITDVWWQ